MAPLLLRSASPESTGDMYGRNKSAVAVAAGFSSRINRHQLFLHSTFPQHAQTHTITVSPVYICIYLYSNILTGAFNSSRFYAQTRAVWPTMGDDRGEKRARGETPGGGGQWKKRGRSRRGTYFSPGYYGYDGDAKDGAGACQPAFPHKSQSSAILQEPYRKLTGTTSSDVASSQIWQQRPKGASEGKRQGERKGLNSGRGTGTSVGDWTVGGGGGGGSAAISRCEWLP